MLIWIIGLSGSGKSTVGRLVAEALKKSHADTVFLDGDRLRQAVSFDLGYSEADRRVSELRRSRLCQLLSEQGMRVVCAAISNCPDIRAWCRSEIPGYVEVYLRSSLDTLRTRDPKGLYGRDGSAPRQVVGVDIPFQEPTASDLVLDMDDAMTPDKAAGSILEHLQKIAVSHGFSPRRVNA